jgi:hypothetical protein
MSRILGYFLRCPDWNTNHRSTTRQIWILCPDSLEWSDDPSWKCLFRSSRYVSEESQGDLESIVRKKSIMYVCARSCVCPCTSGSCLLSIN